MPRVLVAPDKFKGTLTASEVSRHLAEGLTFGRPDIEVTMLPMADGGEGTLDAALSAGFERVPALVAGPTGHPLRAAYARRGRTAVIELAVASGLGTLAGGIPNPLEASSRGTGELVAAALETGCREIILGIGGSACTDGGAGLVQALGARILDSSGKEVQAGGGPLAGAAVLDLEGLHPALEEANVIVACDVDNPLLGPHGAASVYGPQKGATSDDVALLEESLAKWAEVVGEAKGGTFSDVPGAGAAGGVGFAAMAILAAQMRPGIAMMLELTGFNQSVAGAALAVTGEGCLDSQTLRESALRRCRCSHRGRCAHRRRMWPAAAGPWGT